MVRFLAALSALLLIVADVQAQPIPIGGGGGGGFLISVSAPTATLVANGGQIASSSTAFSASTATFTPADVGKIIMIAGGASTSNWVFQTTIAAFVDANDITLTAAPTQSTNNQSLITSVAVLAAGTGVNPGDLITFAGGTTATGGVAAQAPVATTQVITATANAAGTGGTANASCTFTDTTGTVIHSGTHASFTTTLSGTGTLTGAVTVASAGVYSGNPNVTSEPVTVVSGCGSLINATVNLTFGAQSFGTPTNAGAYTSVPTSFTQSATSGAGTGTTATPTSVLGQSFIYGNDATVGLNAATAAVPATGSRVFVPGGNYLTSSPLFLVSNTDLDCARGATFIAEKSSQSGNGTTTPSFTPLVINKDWNALVITDRNISIQGCGASYQWLVAPGTTFSPNKAFSMNFTQTVWAERLFCFMAGDCTAMYASSDTHVVNNTALAISNACWDHWFHPGFSPGTIGGGVVAFNRCTITSSGAGVFYNSSSGTDGSVAQAGVIEGNTIQGPGTIGIWVGSVGISPTVNGAVLATLERG